MAQVTYSATKFDKGMTPKVFTPNSATRIEHFDTITEVLRPFRTLISSPNNQAVATTALALIGFDILNDSIYGVGIDHADPTHGAIYKWNTTGFDWEDNQSMGGTYVPNSMLQAHAGYLFGIVNNRYLYRFDGASTFNMTFYDMTSISYFADAITHSKDGKMYYGADNKIHSVTSTGSAGSLALTLPNANFRITSLCEQGNYIQIAGYDTKTGESASLLWDRDTSVVDLTESYALGRDTVVHNVCLLGQTFTVQIRGDSSNSRFQEKPVLVIKYLNGAQFDTLYEFPVASISTAVNMIGAKYQSLDRFYFTAKVQFDGESASRNICFCLDYKGRLTIAQNLAINTGTNPITGVLRSGEGFWFGAGSDGAWNTTGSVTANENDYQTIAPYETNDIRSDNLEMNIDFKKAIITCEPLPISATVSAGSFVVGLPYEISVVGTTDFTLIGASSNTVGVKFIATGVGSGSGSALSKSAIVVKMRKNEETTFTTVAILTGTNTAKFSLTEMKVKNALSGLDRARQVRIRLESTVGAVITGFQAIFNEVADDTI